MHGICLLFDVVGDEVAVHSGCVFSLLLCRTGMSNRPRHAGGRVYTCVWVGGRSGCFSCKNTISKKLKSEQWFEPDFGKGSRRRAEQA